MLFADFLKRDPIDSDVDSLFSDWTVANLVQDPAVDDGRYAYASSAFHASATGTASVTTPFLGSVPQYAPNYIDIPSGATSATFAGEPTVGLIDAVDRRWCVVEQSWRRDGHPTHA